ncbi:MAG: response regulator [Candidatus Cyclobacteriaceae bacterium M2_1C_046]
MFSGFSTARVLVIEDNTGDYVLIQEFFKEELKNPKIVHSPTFAKAKSILLEDDDFDGILLDLSLPDNQGEKLIHDIVSLAGEIPVVVLTGYEDKEFGIRTLSLGVSDYLLKDELSSSILTKSLAYSIERKKINTQLKEAEEKRKKHELELTKAIISAQERERIEIGGELHDNVNQILFATKMNLSLAKDEMDREKALVWMQNCNDYINMAIDELRNLSHQLAPRSLLKSSLTEAVNNLLKSINMDKSYKISLDFKAFDESLLNEDLKLNIYRILQEQVKNIVKYSKASIIEVDLNTKENDFKLRICDNGKGFDLNSVERGIGLSNIERRAELFYGDIIINTGIEKGCEIIVEIPLSSSETKKIN